MAALPLNRSHATSPGLVSSFEDLVDLRFDFGEAGVDVHVGVLFDLLEQFDDGRPYLVELRTSV